MPEPPCRYRPRTARAPSRSCRVRPSASPPGSRAARWKDRSWDCLRGQGRAPQRSANFWRERKQIHEALRQIHVTSDLDRFKGHAAVNHRCKLGRGRGKDNVGILDRAAFDTETAAAERRFVADFAESEAE